MQGTWIPPLVRKLRSHIPAQQLNPRATARESGAAMKKLCAAAEACPSQKK